MTIEAFTGQYQFLSNFYRVDVVYEDIVYSSVEHAYQAAKTEDRKVRELFARVTLPGEVKRMGRAVAVRPDWDRVKLAVMEQLLWYKFSDPLLRSKLLTTGQEQLVEGNYWHDTFWGACTCEKHRGVGQNHLGRLLMQIRKECMESGKRRGAKSAGET